MKKRFSCALLGLALMIGLSGHALAADDITAPRGGGRRGADQFLRHPVR